MSENRPFIPPPKPRCEVCGKADADVIARWPGDNWTFVCHDHSEEMYESEASFMLINAVFDSVETLLDEIYYRREFERDRFEDFLETLMRYKKEIYGEPKTA